MISSGRDARVRQLSEQLSEIEQRLIPTGLHVFGRASELKEKSDLLRMVASFDRPEHGARALSRLVAEGLRITGYEQLVQEAGTSETKELIDAIVTESVNRFGKAGCEAAVAYLIAKANVDREEALSTFRLLANVSEQLESNHEMESLRRSLRGEYIQPGPGADVIQNPSVLPMAEPPC